MLAACADAGVRLSCHERAWVCSNASTLQDTEHVKSSCRLMRPLLLVAGLTWMPRHGLGEGGRSRQKSATIHVPVSIQAVNVSTREATKAARHITNELERRCDRYSIAQRSECSVHQLICA